MGQIIRGNDLMLFAKGTGSTYESIAWATNHTLTLQGEVLQTSTKDHGKWSAKQISKLSYSINADHLFSTLDFGKLFDKMIAREEIPIIFGVASNADDDAGMPSGGWTPDQSNCYKGAIVLTSLNINASESDNASFSMSAEGVGKLEHVNANSNQVD